jgi:hypothetical protein
MSRTRKFSIASHESPDFSQEDLEALGRYQPGDRIRTSISARFPVIELTAGEGLILLERFQRLQKINPSVDMLRVHRLVQALKPWLVSVLTDEIPRVLRA